MVNIVTPPHLEATHNKRTQRVSGTEQGSSTGTPAWSWEHKVEMLVTSTSGTTAIPPPEHADGQELLIKAVGPLGSFETLTGKILGANARSDDNKTYFISTGAGSFSLRAYELLRLVSNGGDWQIVEWKKEGYRGYNGGGYLENTETGSYWQCGITTANPIAERKAVVYPVSIAFPTQAQDRTSVTVVTNILPGDPVFSDRFAGATPYWTNAGFEGFTNDVSGNNNTIAFNWQQDEVLPL